MKHADTHIYTCIFQTPSDQGDGHSVNLHVIDTNDLQTCTALLSLPKQDYEYSCFRFFPGYSLFPLRHKEEEGDLKENALNSVIAVALMYCTHTHIYTHIVCAMCWGGEVVEEFPALGIAVQCELCAVISSESRRRGDVTHPDIKHQQLCP